MAQRAPRLPGFRFETQAPPLPETLPRMDIAVFVGFAASGPLDIPVAVESAAQFEAIFGRNAPLAWDVEKGEQVYAYLAPAVRAFFRNNGRRCWIIRVAHRRQQGSSDQNSARSNYFPIPNLARVEFNDDGSVKRVMPAFARARSEGSWSDSIRAGSALLARPAQVASPLSRKGKKYALRVIRDAGDPVTPGELLQLDFKAERLLAFLAVDEAQPVQSSPPHSSQLLEVSGGKIVWFKPVASSDLPASQTAISAQVFTRERASSPTAEPLSSDWFEPTYDTSCEAITSGTIDVRLIGCSSENAPSPGSIINIEVASFPVQHWWMTVDTVSAGFDTDIGATIRGPGFSLLPAPGVLPGTPPRCQRLGFELVVSQTDEYTVNLSDLGFDAAHERYWARLPTDEEVYAEPAPSLDTPATVLWRQVGDLFRFPLAGIRQRNEMYFPLAMSALAENLLSPVRLPQTELERDGLASFAAGLFIDRDLFDSRTSDLAGTAEYLAYTGPTPRLLKGMHAAFFLEEATIIAIPDAIHSGWTRHDPAKLEDPPTSTPPYHANWRHFLDCHSRAQEQDPVLKNCDKQSAKDLAGKLPDKPQWNNFLSCNIRIVDAPKLSSSTKVSQDGVFTLSWASSPITDQSFILEESVTPNFTDVEAIYSGPLTAFTLYGRKTGDYFYRVRAIDGENTSNWSNSVAVQVGAVSSWAVNPECDYSADVLLAVQRSLLRMCAARGDVLGVLSLPKHYREDKAMEHVRLLKATANFPGDVVAPLNLGESKAFTYGAIFHPWPIEREQDQDAALVRMPPCGAVCGMIADRALSRGAWLAPANQPLRGVIELEPEIDPARRLDLQEARVNVVRQEPRGFLVLDADTLSDDPDLRPINVRRLLILLRRQALKLGATYVFEPNSSAFRRMVDRGFNDMLDYMFERGAFAGNNPATSYQVVTDESLNTPESVDQGRFIVELRVAPSLPMSFLTIRLVQTSERSLATEVR
jgi:hypothetical protein